MTPIIILAGNAGAGKDTVAAYIANRYGGVAVGQADPLKLMARDFFGFTDAQLFGPSENRNAVDDRYYSDDAWAQARLRTQDLGPGWCQTIFGSKTPTPALLSWFDGLRREMRGVRFPEQVLGATWVEIGGGHTLVDDQDLHIMNDRTWWLKNDKRRGTQYAVTDINSRRVRLHRLILETGIDSVVDHINGYGLDNRRLNLRVATQAQNHGNQEKRKKAWSTSKGVSFDRTREKWTAKICVNYQTRNLGRFSTEDEATEAYRLAAREVFGDFAIQTSRFGLTARRVLQTLGTEFGRAVSENGWARYARETALKLVGGGWAYTRQHGLVATPGRAPYNLAVITDGRFANEIVGVQTIGGAAVKVVRPDTTLRLAAENGGAPAHRSEAELDGIPDHFYSAVIENRAGMRELHRCVDHLIADLFGIPPVQGFGAKKAA